MHSAPGPRRRRGGGRDEPTRRREIRRYYGAISDAELRSSVEPVVVDFWDSIDRYAAELGPDRRWLDVGGGRGDLGAEAHARGWVVTMTEILPALVREARRRHPALRRRIVPADAFDAGAMRRLGGPYQVVTALGGVLNHARDRRQLGRGFGHLVALTGRPGLLVVDLMVRECVPGWPVAVWADFHHVLPGLDDLHRLAAPARLVVLELHSTVHRYPATARTGEFEERMLRVFFRRPR